MSELERWLKIAISWHEGAEESNYFSLTNMEGKEILSLTSEQQSLKHSWFFNCSVFGFATLAPMCTVQLDTLAAQSDYWSHLLFKAKTSEECHYFISLGFSKNTKNKEGILPTIF